MLKTSKKIKLASLITLAIGAHCILQQPASANIVVNGTFDYDLSGWTIDNVTCCTGWTVFRGNPPGSYEDGNVSSVPALLSQTLPTQPGSLYDISFDLLHNDLGTSDSIQVSFGGVNLLGPAPIPYTGGVWQTFAYTNIPATSTATTLTFAGFDNPSYFYVDNVKATPGPLPALGAAASFGFTRRLRRRIRRARSF